MTFTGAVLCGGQSRRMGADKALLTVEGAPMASRVADALRQAGAAEVLAIGGDQAGLVALGLRFVPDDQPGGGPFRATATALRAATEPLVVVASCDLLHPDPASLAAVVDALRRADPAVHGAVPIVAGHRQWTHAAWRSSTGGVLDALARDGATSFLRVADRLRLCDVEGLDPRAVADADTPDALRSSGRGTGNLPPMDIPEIDVTELARVQGEGIALIDVREADEFATARVPGALHIPLGEIEARLAEVPTDGTVYVICASGGRSAKAVAHYRAHGIEAVNVAGGTLGWIDAGQPVDGA